MGRVCTFACAARSTVKMFRIYHTSDLHDHRGIARYLSLLRKEAPGLLIDCGDTLRGSQTVYHRDEPIIDEMNEAGYDLGVPGNREFHYIHRLMQARLEKMQRPLICANLIDRFGRPLPFAREYSAVFDERRMIRFFGLIVMQYPTDSPWERLLGWRFLDPITVAKEIASGVTPDEVLVILSHLGLEMDRQLAQAVPRIDLILGGHSHDTLQEPEYVGDVPIIHAGPYGRYVSATDLTYDTQRKRARIAQSSLLPLLPPVLAVASS